jgi:chaperone BCS1
MRILGFSMFASVLDGGLGGGGFVSGGADNGGTAANAVVASLRLFLLGTLIETGRGLFQWVIERFKLFRGSSKVAQPKIFKLTLLSSPLLEYSITAQFLESDPAYEWIVLLLVSLKSDFIRIPTDLYLTDRGENLDPIAPIPCFCHLLAS